MFFSGGAFRQFSSSRIGVLLSSEIVLHFIPLCLGVLLIINASVPPMPSFFPEVAIVEGLNSVSLSLFLIFVLLRFSVCYYNSYLFLWCSQVKASFYTKTEHRLSELVVLTQLVGTSFVSLGFLRKL